MPPRAKRGAAAARRGRAATPKSKQAAVSSAVEETQAPEPEVPLDAAEEQSIPEPEVPLDAAVEQSIPEPEVPLDAAEGPSIPEPEVPTDAVEEQNSLEPEAPPCVVEEETIPEPEFPLGAAEAEKDPEADATMEVSGEEVLLEPAAAETEPLVVEPFTADEVNAPPLDSGDPASEAIGDEKDDEMLEGPEEAAYGENEGEGDQMDQDQAFSGLEKDAAEVETGDGLVEDTEGGGVDNADIDEGGDKVGDDDKSGSDGEEDNEEEVFMHAPMTERKRQKEFEIFVGGLDREAVEEDLIKVFGEFGEIQGARIVKNPATQKSKGFGFIRYTTIEQAKKVLADYADGIEVRGRLCGISASQDNDTLYLGNICKTWTKDQVVTTLKGYGVEQIDDILFPEDPKGEGKSKGYAFLEFNTHSDAMAAFQRLRKPDAIFGCDRSARVAFAPSSMHPSEEALSQVKTVYVEGLPDFWDEEKVTEHCKQYGEIEKVQLSKNFNTSKRRDFGFIAFTSRESAMACVEGINNAQLGEGELKVKANLAKPQNKGRLAKLGARGGFRIKKDGEYVEEGGHSNTKGYVNFKGYEGKGKGHFKPKSDKWHKPSYPQGRGNQGYGGGRGQGNQGYGGGRGQGGGRSYGGGRGGHGGGRGGHGGGRGGHFGGRGQIGYRQKREEPFRGGKRGGRGMDNTRSSKKGRGNMRGRPNNFGNQKNSRFGKPKSNYNAHPAAYGDPYAQAYGAPETSYQGQAYGVASGSKRPYSEMDPHGGYAEPAAKQVRDQYGYAQRSVGGPGYDDSQARSAAGAGFAAAPAPPVSYAPDFSNNAGYEAAGYGYPPPPPGNSEYAPGRPYY